MPLLQCWHTACKCLSVSGASAFLHSIGDNMKDARGLKELYQSGLINLSELAEHLHILGCSLDRVNKQWRILGNDKQGKWTMVIR